MFFEVICFLLNRNHDLKVLKDGTSQKQADFVYSKDNVSTYSPTLSNINMKTEEVGVPRQSIRMAYES